MQIISHRGYWKVFEKESNKKVAFKRSFELGLGTETDIRDYGGRIMISHDMPNGSEMSLEELLEIMDGRNLLLALNIKADGMSEQISDILRRYNHTNYFVFDMSLPEMYYEANNTDLFIYTGCSDINRKPPLIDRAVGIWLDAFEGVWYDAKVIDEFLDDGKKVCVVSEDLHSRSNDKQWEMLRKKYSDDDRVILCTNYPEDALDYFGS